MGVAIADGADCLSDLAVLREQGELFGPVASKATAWRAIESVTAPELRGIATAMTTARTRVWSAAPGGGPASLTIDFDATLVTAYSDKQDAAPTYKRGYGFHPLVVRCDETNEPLAAMLRPANAGANNTTDHIALLGETVVSLPEEYRAGHQRGDSPAAVTHPILVRADSAGATHGFVDALRSRNIGFSLGYAIDGRVRDGLLLTQEEQWEPATNADGSSRRDAYVAELTNLIDLTAWGDHTRLICRREQPHPGAQLTLFDTAEGWHHTCCITNTPSHDIAALEVCHRGHARVEDRVRNSKNTGLGNLPFEDYVRNQAWVAASLAASCLLAWTQLVCLNADLAIAEPKTLRYRLSHVAARLAARGRQLHMRIDATWPWRHELAHAYQRLRHTLP